MDDLGIGLLAHWHTLRGPRTIDLDPSGSVFGYWGFGEHRRFAAVHTSHGQPPPGERVHRVSRGVRFSSGSSFRESEMLGTGSATAKCQMTCGLTCRWLESIGINWNQLWPFLFNCRLTNWLWDSRPDFLNPSWFYCGAFYCTSFT